MWFPECEWALMPSGWLNPSPVLCPVQLTPTCAGLWGQWPGLALPVPWGWQSPALLWATLFFTPCGLWGFGSAQHLPP